MPVHLMIWLTPKLRKAVRFRSAMQYALCQTAGEIGTESWMFIVYLVIMYFDLMKQPCVENLLDYMRDVSLRPVSCELQCTPELTLSCPLENFATISHHTRLPWALATRTLPLRMWDPHRHYPSSVVLALPSFFSRPPTLLSRTPTSTSSPSQPFPAKISKRSPLNVNANADDSIA